MVFILSFLSQAILNFLLYNHKHNVLIANKPFHGSEIFASSLLLYPVFGWIADVYWGRYKMIRRSLWVMWLTAVTLSLVSIIPDDLPHATKITEMTDIIILVVMSLSLGGFQANILQFGIDQLPDASSDDLVAFLDLYVWVWCTSIVVVLYSQNCICLKYDALAKLLLPAFLTLALCLDFLLNHWLIKEPTSENPFKLIYKVVRFALKNKHPRLRSAFTYWEDKRYSRIDFAMKKFGGPFTVEEVEDVKTFGRVIIIMVIISFFVGFLTNFDAVASGLIYHLKSTPLLQDDKIHCPKYSSCFERVATYYTGDLAMIVFIPFYRLTLHRLIRRRSILIKFNLGLFVALLKVIGELCLEVIGHTKLSANATNITCLLASKEANYSPSNSLPLDYKWLMIPNTIYGISIYLMLSSTLQFICSQSPYSMKGLIFGSMYGFIGLSFGISALILFPLVSAVHKWPLSRYGCGVWYLLSASIILLLIFLLLSLLSWRYKKRQRSDYQPSEHMFAINYYDQVLNNSMESS